jgi:hypothetical protein
MGYPPRRRIWRVQTIWPSSRRCAFCRATARAVGANRLVELSCPAGAGANLSESGGRVNAVAAVRRAVQCRIPRHLLFVTNDFYFKGDTTYMVLSDVDVAVPVPDYVPARAA